MGRGRKLAVFIIVIILLGVVSSCTQYQTEANPRAFNTSTPWPTDVEDDLIPRLPTQTRYVTATLKTPHYYLPTPKPTLTPEVIASKLRGYDLICPPGNPIDQQALALLIEPTGQYGFSYDDWIPLLQEQQVTELLNRYGIGSFLSYIDHNIGKYFVSYHVHFFDLTGDGVNEFILQWGYTSIYTCKDQQYILLASFEPDGYLRAPEIVEMIDVNGNDHPELLIRLGFTSHGGSWYGVFEYDGESLPSVMDPNLEGIWVEATGNIGFRDIDGDGQYEIYVHVGIPVWETTQAGAPWRQEWDTYEWTGNFFSVNQRDFSQPEFRFQAAYDGDNFSQRGDYDRAQESYTRVILSNGLQGFSPARAQYEQYLSWAKNYNEPFPTLPPDDPSEYPNLAAYAHYRMLLIDILRGQTKQAQVEYELLLKDYPEGTPGSIYAHLAQVFMEEYQNTKSMASACGDVIEVVESNSEEVFKYLGINGYPGMFLPRYTPKDICPFQ